MVDEHGRPLGEAEALAVQSTDVLHKLAARLRGSPQALSMVRDYVLILSWPGPAEALPLARDGKDRELMALQSNAAVNEANSALEKDNEMMNKGLRGRHRGCDDHRGVRLR